MVDDSEEGLKLGPELLQALGSSEQSIEAFAVADLCRGLEDLQKRVGAGQLTADAAEDERQRLLTENHAKWGRYSPCADSSAT